jgi:hypothetical protein
MGSRPRETGGPFDNNFARRAAPVDRRPVVPQRSPALSLDTGGRHAIFGLLVTGTDRRIAMKNTLTCRQAARLMLEDEDHEIDVPERLAVQAHVRVCIMCGRFVNQLTFMRHSMRAWRAQAQADRP